VLKRKLALVCVAIVRVAQVDVDGGPKVSRTFPLPSVCEPGYVLTHDVTKVLRILQIKVI